MCEFYNAGASFCIYMIFKQTGAGVCECVIKNDGPNLSIYGIIF